MAAKKKNLTREDAAELYRDLQKAMAATKTKAKPKSSSGIDAKAIAESIKAAMRKEDAAAGVASTSSMSAPTERPMFLTAGQRAAVCMVMLFAGFKVTLSAMEAAGFATATPVEASVSTARSVPAIPATERFSREELKILTSLDSRRAELEDRNRKLDDRASDLDKRDRELATRLTQLRELTEKLSIERDKGEKKRGAQLDQLANVYGSMNPPEAAALIEQLDVHIALQLLERMPEKRIGQILALMSPARALAITKMLSSAGAQ